MKKKNLLLSILLGVMLLSSACSKENEELLSFETSMSNFSSNIVSISDALTAIDPTSDVAVSDMLSNLESMNDELQLFATIDIPEEFSNIESLADDAANYMNNALSLYGDAYASSSVNTSILEAADKNYNRAMTRLSYISDLLQGITPDGDDVIVTESNDSVLFEQD